MSNTRPSNDDLFDFIDSSKKGAYPAGSAYTPGLLTPEWWGYKDIKDGLVFTDEFVAGTSFSMGKEVVTHVDGKVIWGDVYGGRIVVGKENLNMEILDFLKFALGKSEDNFQSFRGPSTFIDGDWEYKYAQTGSIESFTGHEEIFYKGELVFYHDIIGGIVEG